MHWGALNTPWLFSALCLSSETFFNDKCHLFALLPGKLAQVLLSTLPDGLLSPFISAGASFTAGMSSKPHEAQRGCCIHQPGSPVSFEASPSPSPCGLTGAASHEAGAPLSCAWEDTRPVTLAVVTGSGVGM